jgi:signal transduction histidine kinase
MVRIRQVLLNLLNNAVKYTENGFIKFSCIAEKIETSGEDRKDGENIRMIFEVSDTGFGIKEDDLDKLFGNFSRLDINRNRDIEGPVWGLP